MARFRDGAGCIGGVLWVTAWGLVVSGWVMNIMAVIHMAQANSPATTMFILRCVGIIIFPLGALLGWFA